MRTRGRSWWQFKHTYSKILRCVKAGPAFRRKPGWNFPTKKYWCCSSRIPCLLMKWTTRLGGDTALIANLQFMTTFSLYIQKMRVKAKILVRGVLGRWIVTKSLISGKWLWEGSPECKACQAAYINSIEHTGQRKSMSVTWWIEAAFNRKVGRYSAFK